MKNEKEGGIMKVKINNIKACGVLCLLLTTFVAYSQYCNEVLKVFHNKNVELLLNDKKPGYDKANSGDNKEPGCDNLELGSVVFYFSKKPIVNFVPERNSDAKNIKKVFIFPKATLKGNYCQTNVKKINDSYGVGYSLKIEPIKLPIEGVKLSITYDPTIVKIDYKTFESIGDQQGVIFSFYNKRVINRIKNKEYSVLCIV